MGQLAYCSVRTLEKGNRETNSAGTARIVSVKCAGVGSPATSYPPFTFHLATYALQILTAASSRGRRVRVALTQLTELCFLFASQVSPALEQQRSLEARRGSGMRN